LEKFETFNEIISKNDPNTIIKYDDIDTFIGLLELFRYEVGENDGDWDTYRENRRRPGQPNPDIYIQIWQDNISSGGVLGDVYADGLEIGYNNLAVSCSNERTPPAFWKINCEKLTYTNLITDVELFITELYYTPPPPGGPPPIGPPPVGPPP